jgi:hypothetical protein
MDSALDQAIEFLITPTAPPPAAKAVVEELLRAEKTAKQTQVRYTYSQLLGTWRLGFITGTKRSRQRAGVILGAGRFLPSWVKIHLSIPNLSLVKSKEPFKIPLNSDHCNWFSQAHAVLVEDEYTRFRLHSDEGVLVWTKVVRRLHSRRSKPGSPLLGAKPERAGIFHVLPGTEPKHCG